ncbi:MAG: hypothetical protein DUW69_001997 [Verrucomicrobia bacterium]|nr:MAG: hypothetical protein DUW69_001997 [Verrucomicrobiota bacterium]
MRIQLFAATIATLTIATLTLASPAVAQSDRSGRTAPHTYIGGDLLIAQPDGEFKNYVNAAFGASGHLVHSLDDRGIFSLRAELGLLVYGSRTARQSLGGGALGLIAVDVTTSNNIMFGGIGAQVTLPTDIIKPYATGSIGFSYFFTNSEIAGTNNQNLPFASTNNFSDNGFTTMYGGGILIPFKNGKNPIALDLGAQLHNNPDIQYLTKNSIVFNGSNNPPTITAYRSQANFITYRIGVTVGIR